MPTMACGRSGLPTAGPAGLPRGDCAAPAQCSVRTIPRPTADWSLAAGPPGSRDPAEPRVSCGFDSGSRGRPFSAPTAGSSRSPSTTSTQGAWSAWADVGKPIPRAPRASGQLHVADLTSYSGQLVRVGVLSPSGTGAQSASNVPPSSHGWYRRRHRDRGARRPSHPPATRRYRTSRRVRVTWYADNGVWEVGLPTVGPAGCYQGSQCAGTVLNGNYPKTDSRLVSPMVRLAQGTMQNPVLLRFWHWFNFFGLDYGVGQISVFDETLSVWSAWADVGLASGPRPAPGQRTSRDLTAYSGRMVRIGFYHRGAPSGFITPGWYVDDVEFPGAPVAAGPFTDLQNLRQARVTGIPTTACGRSGFQRGPGRGRCHQSADAPGRC